MVKKAAKKSGDFVVIRTRNAGVHCGTLHSVKGMEVVLTDARRVWRWRGANSLHEMANNGCAMDYTRISEPISKISLPEHIELLYCTDKARDNLSKSRWGG